MRPLQLSASWATFRRREIFPVIEILLGSGPEKPAGARHTNHCDILDWLKFDIFFFNSIRTNHLITSLTLALCAENFGTGESKQCDRDYDFWSTHRGHRLNSPCMLACCGKHDRVRSKGAPAHDMFPHAIRTSKLMRRHGRVHLLDGGVIGPRIKRCTSHVQPEVNSISN